MDIHPGDISEVSTIYRLFFYISIEIVSEFVIDDRIFASDTRVGSSDSPVRSDLYIIPLDRVHGEDIFLSPVSRDDSLSCISEV